MRKRFRGTTNSSQLTIDINKLLSCQLSTVNCQPLPPQGQSLLEVVISVAIAAILAIALITTTLISQRTSESAKNNTIATKLAQEGLESVRVFRDRNGYNLLINGNCYVVSTITDAQGMRVWRLYTSPCPELKQIDNTAFYRKLSIENNPSDPSGNTKLIKVEVTWQDPQGNQSIKSETILSRWEQF